MAKRVDPLKAKAAKQRKIAIGGAVLLLGLIAIQGPKTLKMLQGPQAVDTPASAAAPTTPGVPTSPTPAGTPAPPATGQELAAVADSDAAPEPEEGQLATFERFATKDPFVQQAEPEAAAPEAAATDGGAPVPDGGAPLSDADQAAADQAGAADEGAAADAPATGGFTAGGTETPAPPEQPAVAGATSIAVNGVAEDVAIDGTFPKDQPTFVLVSLAKNGKSVQVGIAGGEYAGGADTMTLTFGKKITLQNTADGSRYELELRAIQGFPVPKPKQ